MWVSQPEGTDRSDPVNVSFEGMTPDGKNIFFDTNSPLLDEDVNSGPDLYRFTVSDNPATDSNLTLITNDGGAVNDPGTGSFGAALVGMSNDGRRVYVHDIGAHLDLWQEGIGIRVIDPGLARPTEATRQLAFTASQPGLGRVSPDGEWVAYLSDGEMHLYSLRDDRVTCVSCPFGATVVPRVTNTGEVNNDGFRPHFLSDDGKVFFTSTGALVPQDGNGVADVYQYDGQTRELTLLTSGKGRDPAMFSDASPSGDDVFVVTRQPLAPNDTDDYVDLYDVRVGLAPPSPPAGSAPACEGDACQGALSGSPADDSLGSLSFDGDESGSPGHPGLTIRRRAVLHGAVGAIHVKLAVPGRLRWTGRGLVAGSAKRDAGTTSFRLRLGQRARTQLKRSGHYATTVHLTFQAAGGVNVTRSIRVTFRAAAKKGR